MKRSTISTCILGSAWLAAAGPGGSFAGTCPPLRDGAGRVLELICYNTHNQPITLTYVDTLGRRTALPPRPSQPARFGQGPQALTAYLRAPVPWPGNLDAAGFVTFTLLIGADGRVKDARFMASRGLGFWPACTPLARQRVLAMPRWQPALLHGKPIPSVTSVAVRFSTL